MFIDKVHFTRCRLLEGALLVLLVAGCAKPESESATGDPVSVTEQAVVLSSRDIASVTRGRIDGGIVITGTLEPYRRVDVKAQVPGTLREVQVDRGVAVRSGAVMAEVDAQGIRSMASGAVAAVAAAEANVAQAKRQLESARTLHEAGAMADLDFQQVETMFEAAQAQLAGAKAQADGAAEQASHTVVRAPFNGVVSDRKIEIGEAVNPGQPLFTLVNTDYLELAGQVPVGAAIGMKTGQPVIFQLNDLPEERFEGTVARIEPTANPETRQIGVYLRLPNPGNRLVGGLFATGRIVTESAEASLLVPTPALRGNEGNTYVLGVRADKLERLPVQVIARDDGWGMTAIDADLTEGDLVLVAPKLNVTEGQRVQFPDPGEGTVPTTPASHSEK